MEIYKSSESFSFSFGIMYPQGGGGTEYVNAEYIYDSENNVWKFNSRYGQKLIQSFSENVEYPSGGYDYSQYNKFCNVVSAHFGGIYTYKYAETPNKYWSYKLNDTTGDYSTATITCNDKILTTLDIDITNFVMNTKAYYIDKGIISSSYSDFRGALLKSGSKLLYIIMIRNQYTDEAPRVLIDTNHAYLGKINSSYYGDPTAYIYDMETGEVEFSNNIEYDGTMTSSSVEYYKLNTINIMNEDTWEVEKTYDINSFYYIGNLSYSSYDGDYVGFDTYRPLYFPDGEVYQSITGFDLTEMKNQWVVTPSQLSQLKGNILPNIIGFGKDGIVVGDNSYLKQINLIDALNNVTNHTETYSLATSYNINCTAGYNFFSPYSDDYDQSSSFINIQNQVRIKRPNNDYQNMDIGINQKGSTLNQFNYDGNTYCAHYEGGYMYLMRTYKNDDNVSKCRLEKWQVNGSDVTYIESTQLYGVYGNLIDFNTSYGIGSTRGSSSSSPATMTLNIYDMRDNTILKTATIIPNITYYGTNGLIWSSKSIVVNNIMYVFGYTYEYISKGKYCIRIVGMYGDLTQENITFREIYNDSYTTSNYNYTPSSEFYICHPKGSDMAYVYHYYWVKNNNDSGYNRVCGVNLTTKTKVIDTTVSGYSNGCSSTSYIGEDSNYYYFAYALRVWKIDKSTGIATRIFDTSGSSTGRYATLSPDGSVISTGAYVYKFDIATAKRHSILTTEGGMDGIAEVPLSLDKYHNGMIYKGMTNNYTAVYCNSPHSKYQSGDLFYCYLDGSNYNGTYYLPPVSLDNIERYIKSTGLKNS